MLQGILAIRHMHMRVLRETGMSTADEMLYPDNLQYLSDIMSYIAVGARSVENQYHRLVASGCDVPVGMKNPTSGDMTVMLNSVVAAQLPHDFIFRGDEVSCPGNPLTHVILRGAVNKRGQCSPNYHYEDLRLLYDLYSQRELKSGLHRGHQSFQLQQTVQRAGAHCKRGTSQPPLLQRYPPSGKGPDD